MNNIDDVNFKLKIEEIKDNNDDQYRKLHAGDKNYYKNYSSDKLAKKDNKVNNHSANKNDLNKKLHESNKISNINNISESSNNTGNKLNNISKSSNNTGNKLNNKLLSKAMSNVLGIPKSASDSLASSKLGQNALNNVKNKIPGMKALDLLSGKSRSKSDASNGKISDIKFELPELKKIGIIVAIAGVFILVFCCLIITSSNVYLNVMKLYHADSSSNIDSSINSMSDEEKTSEVTDEDIDEDAYINENIDFNIVNISRKVKKYKKSDLEDLEDFYPDIKNYTQDENINDLNPVYNFFYKLKDISEYYLENYSVSIDLPLLMATLNIQSDDAITVFKLNAENYKPNKEQNVLEKLFKPEYFKYDYDWTDYLNNYTSNNYSEHDIEILVQNMVVKNSSGVYEIDDEHYIEFLREFIEKKYYININENNTYEGDYEESDDTESSSETEKEDNSDDESNISSESSSIYATSMISLALNEYKVADKKSLSNSNKYTKYYGNYVGPWCVVFAWYVAANTTVNGVSIYPDLIGIKSASTGTYMKYFLKGDSSRPNVKFYYNDSCSKYKGKNGSSTKYKPKAGDFIFIDWSAKKWTTTSDTQDHTGLVTSSDDKHVYTVEGNTGVGGKIKTKSYSLSDCRIIGYGSWY